MPGRGSRTAPLRPAGPARGAWAFAAAWVVGVAIALLTGASSVVILLMAGLVAMAAGFVAAPLRLRRAGVVGVELPAVATTGEPLTAVVEVTGRWPVHVEVRVARPADGAVATAERVAAGWCRSERCEITGTGPARGRWDEVRVTVASAGRIGLFWWRRSFTVRCDPMWVAPAAAAVPAHTMPLADEAAGVAPGAPVRGHDELDSVRPWRDGDEAATIHWPSSWRAGEVIVRQQRTNAVERHVVEARRGTGDAAAEAARVRSAVEAAWSLGAGASIVEVDGTRIGEPHDAADPTALLRWAAVFDGPDPTPPPVPWWRRPVGVTHAEPDTSVVRTARWTIAAACLAPAVMVLQPLGYGAFHIAVVAAGLAAGAGLTTMRHPVAKGLRQSMGLACGVGVGAALIDVSAVDTPASVLRFVMPQVLLALFVMQGFECTDRRSARVTLAIAAVLVAYAGGIRVDDRLGAWLLASILLLAVASQLVGRPDRRPATRGSAAAPSRGVRWRHGLAPVTGAALAAISTVAGLVVIPVPDGPAQLTLPSFLSERREVLDDGGLATPGGSPLLGGAVQGPGKRTGGAAASYPGFSNRMDTSLRGNLGDEVVLRVRSPQPDFWRGQTFTTFDGTTWFVDEDAGLRTEGPDHAFGRASGDVLGVADGETLLQTFYPQVDLPNIIFAAPRAYRLLLDAPVWQRLDGALRAGVVLPAGSAYTVLSVRSSATPDSLASQGDLAALGAPAQYVQLPGTTTERTRQLAAELAEGTTSTYEVIQAIDAWLTDHVAYDLEASLPPEGGDAVDWFLFESRRGFCEQIASAMAVLLRSLGVPARIATGYVPSERDHIAGVWISRAHDAHAWVEVRFPDDGWVAFDPTAAVPLPGEADDVSVGGELFDAVAGFVTDHAPHLVLGGGGLLVVIVAGRSGRAAVRRRRRGRWGVLQDRFTVAATRAGAGGTEPNRDLAEVLTGEDARWLADELDRSAFSPSWQDDDAVYQRGRTVLVELEHAGRR